MQQDALFYWLALWRVKGLGPAKIEALLDQCGSAQAIFDHSAQLKVPQEIRTQLTSNSAENNFIFKGAEIDLQWMNASPLHHIITWQDPEYPSLLRNTVGAPPVLFIKGQVNLLQQLQIGIVGTRHPTPSARTDAHAFAQQLTQKGWIITSGLAQGIDACAHEGALSVGKTIAVLAHGLDTIYPSQNNALANKICKQGALVSEFPIGTPPHAQLFPRRNRVISGLSRGVLVVEAAQRSGSLITARCAVEQNREVFAIPGSIHNPVAKGCHELLRQGAYLVESVEDITNVLGVLEPKKTFPILTSSSDLALGYKEKAFNLANEQQDNSKKKEIIEPAKLPELSENEQSLYRLLKTETTSIDYLVENSRLAPAAVSSLLTLLEMKGAIESVAGGYCRSN